MADIDNVRTLEDLISVVRKLYFNMDKLDATYYNMFINPEPMVIELERYDETGRLTTVYLKNRAAELSPNLTGYGPPSIPANIGVFYTDLNNGYLYYKTTSTGSDGWEPVYSGNNKGTLIQEGSSASTLIDLNVSAVSEGVLSTSHGGTGVSGTFEGLLKANGTSACTRAVEGVDYIDPNNLVGMIAYFPKNETRDNWLICDGSTFTTTTYPSLYTYLGGTNVLPDLRDRFIRSWDGSSTSSGKAILDKNSASVGQHTHELSSGTIACAGAGGHSHSKGSMRIQGSIVTPNDDEPLTNADGTTNSGCLKLKDKSSYGGQGTSSGAGYRTISLDTNLGGWTGSTSTENNHTHTISLSGSTAQNSGNAEPFPKNIILVPMIYAGPKVSA